MKKNSLLEKFCLKKAESSNFSFLSLFVKVHKKERNEYLRKLIEVMTFLVHLTYWLSFPMNVANIYFIKLKSNKRIALLLLHILSQFYLQTVLRE